MMAAAKAKAQRNKSIQDAKDAKNKSNQKQVDAAKNNSARNTAAKNAVKKQAQKQAKELDLKTINQQNQQKVALEKTKGQLQKGLVAKKQVAKDKQLNIEKNKMKMIQAEAAKKKEDKRLKLIADAKAKEFARKQQELKLVKGKVVASTKPIAVATKVNSAGKVVIAKKPDNGPKIKALQTKNETLKQQVKDTKKEVSALQ